MNFLTLLRLSTRFFFRILPGLLLISCGDSGPVDDEPDPIEPGQEEILYIVAGISGTPGSSGDGGLAIGALLNFPRDVTPNPLGIVHIVDYENNCIRTIDTDGIISRTVGTGLPGDDTAGSASGASIDHPAGITIGQVGDLYISAWKNCKIKKVDLATQTISVTVGTTPGFSGDGGPAELSQLDHPSSLVFGEDGNAYLSDQANQRVRKIDSTGNITTFAGNGIKGYRDGAGDQAQFAFPSGPDALPGGRVGWGHHPYGILVADTDNHRVRFINLETRQVFTVAGTGVPGYSGDGGPAASAQLNSPTDVYMSEDHEIFVADSKNHVIRKINAVGQIETVVGTGQQGSSPDGTSAKSAKLNTPTGLHFVEATRELYIADTYNHLVRKVKLIR
jgi:hypothetical protein